jgi:type VII secretion-associated serine protease mycosin
VTGRWLRRTVVACTCTGIVLATASPAHADAIRDRQWHLGALKIPDAQRLSRGEGVIVALVDSGVDASHPDLTANVLPGANVVSGGKSDGRQDPQGHGTAMAGLIVAHGHGDNDGDGALGIAPAAKVIPIRTSNADGFGNDTLLAAGIDEAVRAGAKVISLSVGATGTPKLRESVQRAVASDAVIVAAMGNHGEDALPTALTEYDGVVAVGATDRNGDVAPVTITGSQLIISAPGVDVVSTSNNNHGYRVGTGTSDATAIVAGTAALVRSKYPNLSAREVIHRLTATATDKGAPGRDDQYGYGIVNPVAALTADVRPESPSAPALPAEPGRSDQAAPAALPTSDSASAILVLALVAAGLLAAVVATVVVRRRQAS